MLFLPLTFSAPGCGQPGTGPGQEGDDKQERELDDQVPGQLVGVQGQGQDGDQAGHLQQLQTGAAVPTQMQDEALPRQLQHLYRLLRHLMELAPNPLELPNDRL